MDILLGMMLAIQLFFGVGAATGLIPAPPSPSVAESLCGPQPCPAL